MSDSETWLLVARAAANARIHRRRVNLGLPWEAWAHPRSKSAYSYAVYLRATALKPQAKSIDLLPLTKASWILRLLLGQRYFKRAIYPTIADTQHEYLEAVVMGHPREAQLIRARGYFSLVSTLLATVISPIVNLLRRILGPPGGNRS